MNTAFDLASSQPWLMLPDALDNLLAISERLGDPAALEARLGHKLNNTRNVVMRNGVAIIPVVGPIFRYANLLTEISGATSTQILATDIRQALDNLAVKSIVLNIDSPGGVASGINELADMIYAGRSQKRIVAYIGGTGASAAYWIASAAHEVVVDDTAVVGSIGVVVEVTVDAAAAKGPKRYEIVSRNAPNKRPDLATEQGRAKVGETVDAMASVFESKVARNLGVARASVPAMGGHGGLLVGAAAVKSGLAHRLGSLEHLIAELSSPSAGAIKIQPGKPKPLGSVRPGFAAAAAALAAEGGTPEHARVLTILAMAELGLENEAIAAVKQNLSVEAAALFFLRATSSKPHLAAVAQRLAIPGAPPPQFSTNQIWYLRRRPKK
ncbi:S49 family peptidase [Pseudomonas sp. DWP3-1-2]|uniref:S49 family peptidase n=1 Tax=Pseudomonas sp. DWP3-1-2 TaxID=2804645 RepID=UPI003CF6A5A3